MRHRVSAFITGLAISVMVQQPFAHASGMGNQGWQLSCPSPIILAKPAKLLNATKVKTGERVTAKVISDLECDGKLIISRGSVLIGHITEVQRRSKLNRESHLGFTFDQIKLTDGTVLPFKGTIEDVQQYFGAYDAYLNSLRVVCEKSSDGHCVQYSEPLDPVDRYNLKTITMRSDGPQGILLSSTKHNIKLGWDIEIILRVSPS